MFAKKDKKRFSEIFANSKAKRQMKKEERNRFKMVPDKKKSHKWLIFPIVFVLLLALIVYTLYDNGRIVVERVTVSHAQVPVSFDGFRILQISDLHGKKFGSENKNLIQQIDSLEYDMILLTGDYMSNPKSDDYWDIIDLGEGTRMRSSPGNCVSTPPLKKKVTR